MAAGSSEDLLRQLVDASACSVAGLDAPQLQTLRDLTQALAPLRPDAEAEYERFLGVQKRELLPVPAAVREGLEGARILVTGGTGCIGTELLAELVRYQPAVLASVTRGLTTPATRFDSVDYYTADVRDADAVDAVMAQVRPDIVFHLAAQRSPGAAELDPEFAITTNVLGTQVVARSAVEHGVGRLVYASTGKAVRYYTREKYAATKKIGEVVVGGYAGQIGVGVARFTHVVDNSIIHERLQQWVTDGVIPLHAPYLALYAQSATESAQLLLMASQGRVNAPLLYSLRDLECFFDLVDLALGIRARTRSTAALCFTGFGPGYGSPAHIAQYDPRNAGDTGPLINLIEAGRAGAAHGDSLNELRLATHLGTHIAANLADLNRLARDPHSPDDLCRALEATSRELVFGELLHIEPEQLRRMERMTFAAPESEHPEHLVINSAMKNAALRQTA